MEEKPKKGLLVFLIIVAIISLTTSILFFTGVIKNPFVKESRVAEKDHKCSKTYKKGLSEGNTIDVNNYEECVSIEYELGDYYLVRVDKQEDSDYLIYVNDNSSNITFETTTDVITYVYNDNLVILTYDKKNEINNNFYIFSKDGKMYYNFNEHKDESVMNFDIKKNEKDIVVTTSIGTKCKYQLGSSDIGFNYIDCDTSGEFKTLTDIINYFGITSDYPIEKELTYTLLDNGLYDTNPIVNTSKTLEQLFNETMKSGKSFIID